ncbi:MAG TPA: hypothetical protein VNI83_13730 [Vicinamibacterales bacterium]|nr:hypothetical protein [Vicinamibacterales bacterium]
MLREFFRTSAILAALLLLPRAAAAQNCGLQTLSGGYAYAVVAQAVVATELGLLLTSSELANLTFDGQGAVTGTVKRQFGSAFFGTTFIENVSLSGQYTVNPDCTGRLTLTTTTFPQLTGLEFVLAGRGEQLLSNGALFAVGAVEWKRRASRCEARTISGEYAFAGTPIHGFPELNLRLPDRELGILAFDHRLGSVSGTLKRLTPDGQQTVNLTGSYVVNPDCTGSILFDNPGEPAQDFVVVGRGEEILSLATSTQENLLATFTWKRR